MKKKLLSFISMGLLAVGSMMANLNEYGIPEYIQNGNILHCFDWSFSQIQNNLGSIRNAGFGAVQVSPVQGNCANGAEWYYAYLPYDFAMSDSKANGQGTRAQLKALCEAADAYGIKIIVDVVANHINPASGYRDPWWNTSGYLRDEGGVNYGSRYSITHGNVGDYQDVVSEHADVQARAKAFIEDLKSLGVKGIRWDAAKHIALPSEGCDFWTAVTSVEGMYHYGEILDGPGGDKYNLLREYSKYMSMTDTEYSDAIFNAFNSGTAPNASGSWKRSNVSEKRLVYWGESHDTYSNDNGKTKNVNQNIIDRAYAIGACRQYATALYFSRPWEKDRTKIRMGVQGQTSFTNASIREVNIFRNKMMGRNEGYTSSGNVAVVTRENGGAVIVNAAGAGNVSISNVNGFCPVGEFKDKVSGNTFTVTATTITGTTNAKGIAVIYPDNLEVLDEPNPNEGIITDAEPITTPETLFVIGNLDGDMGWGTVPGKGLAMTKNGDVFTASNVHINLASARQGFFRFSATMADNWDAMDKQFGPTSGNVTIEPNGAAQKFDQYPGDNSFAVAPGTYDITVDFSTLTVSLTGESEEIGNPEVPVLSTLYVMGNTQANGGWAANVGQPMTNDGANVFSIKDVKITNAGGGYGYFSFAQQLSKSTDWDEAGGANDGYRFGPAENDFSTSTGEYEITVYVPGVNASACTSWMILPGTYDFTVDLENYTLTIEGEAGDVGGGGGSSGGETGMKPLYMIGNLTVGSWDTRAGYLMDIEGEYYVGRNLTIVNAGSGYGYFAFCRQLSPANGTSNNWDGQGGVNSADRFGAPSKDTPIAEGDMEKPVTKYAVGVNASSSQSWMILAGTYDFVLNKDINKLSVYTAGTAPSFFDGLEDITAGALYSVTTIAGDITVDGLSGQNVVIAGLDGRVYYNGVSNGSVTVHVGPGVFVVNVDGAGLKVLVK